MHKQTLNIKSYIGRVLQSEPHCKLPIWCDPTILQVSVEFESYNRIAYCVEICVFWCGANFTQILTIHFADVTMRHIDGNPLNETIYDSHISSYSNSIVNACFIEL